MFIHKHAIHTWLMVIKSNLLLSFPLLQRPSLGYFHKKELTRLASCRLVSLCKHRPRPSILLSIWPSFLLWYNKMNAGLFFFSRIRAYLSCKAHWLLDLILALLCASWSGVLSFPALLHAVLMLSGAGIQHWVLLCFPLQIQTSFPYTVHVESP